MAPTSVRAAIILWTTLAVMPAELVFDAIESELERRGIEADPLFALWACSTPGLHQWHPALRSLRTLQSQRSDGERGETRNVFHIRSYPFSISRRTGALAAGSVANSDATGFSPPLPARSE
jgi:hypothetical protein